jgi:hypothetical protein
VFNELKISFFELALGYFSRKSWWIEWGLRRTFPSRH